MSSRWILILALFLNGCSLMVGEKPPEKAQARLGGESSQCLSDGWESWKQFKEGRGADPLVAWVDCSQGALDEFVQNTQGSEGGAYSLSDLKGFLEKYYMKDRRVSRDLLASVFSLKQGLLGGSDRSLSEDELHTIKQLLDVLSQMAQRLAPHMPMTPEGVTKKTSSQYAQAREALFAASEDLAAFVSGGQDYEFEQLLHLLLELQNEVHLAPSRSWIRDGMHVVEALKSLLISTPKDRMRPGDWGDMVRQGIRLYVAFMDWSVLEQERTWLYGTGLDRLNQMVGTSLEVFEAALKRRAGQTITLADLDQVIDAATAESFIPYWPESVRPKTVKGVLCPAFKRFFHQKHPEDQSVDQEFFGKKTPCPDDRTLYGVDDEVLERLKAEYRNWSAKQAILVAMFEKVYEERKLEFQGVGQATVDELLSYSPKPSLAQGVFGGVPSFLPPWLVSALPQADSVSELRKTLSIFRNYPLFGNEGSLVQFSVASPKIAAEHTFYSLSQINWMQSVGQFLMQGYTANENAGTVEEFNRFYWDFRMLGIELRTVDYRHEDTAILRFQEADLFTYAANGSRTLDIHEGVNLLAYMISGRSLGMKVHQEVGDACASEVPEDDNVLGMKTIEPKCFRKEFFGNFNEFYSSMPALLEYYNGLNPERKALFEETLEAAARRYGFSEQLFEYPDTEAIAVLTHYVETVFKRYDTNNSQTITIGEAHKAFEVFESILANIELLKDFSKKDLKAVFFYLLRYGETPGAADFIWWKTFGNWDEIATDRTILLSIMANLKMEMAKASK